MNCKGIVVSAICLCATMLLNSCFLLRGLFLEAEAVAVTSRLSVLRTGVTLSEASLLRNTGRRVVAGQRTVVTTAELSASERVILMQEYNQSIRFLRRVRIGPDNIKKGNSLFIKEAGENIEIARAIGTTKNGETVVQFFNAGKAVSKPFTLPGQLFRVSSNKARLYTGRGTQYRVYSQAIELDDPVFVLEEVKNGWYYVQFRELRGYMLASDLALVTLLGENEKEKLYDQSDLFIPDEAGSGSICFTNLSNKPIAIVLRQNEKGKYEEATPYNFNNVIFVVQPAETAAFTSLPISCIYSYTVYSNFPIPVEEKIERAYLVDYIDKGNIILSPNGTRYILTKGNDPLSAEIQNGILDNSIVEVPDKSDSEGDIGFVNETSNTISVFIAAPFGPDQIRGTASPSNGSAAELLIPPGEKRFFYGLNKSVLYHYSVYKKPETFNRSNALVAYDDNFLFSSDFYIQEGNKGIRVISKSGYMIRSANNETKNTELCIKNSTGERIAIFLCFGQNECSAYNMNADWAILEPKQQIVFEGLLDNTLYSVKAYTWPPYSTRSLIREDERSVLKYSFNNLSEKTSFIEIPPKPKKYYGF